MRCVPANSFEIATFAQRPDRRSIAQAVHVSKNLVGKIRRGGRYGHKGQNGRKNNDLDKDKFGIRAALVADPTRSNAEIARELGVFRHFGQIRACVHNGHKGLFGHKNKDVVKDGRTNSSVLRFTPRGQFRQQKQGYSHQGQVRYHGRFGVFRHLEKNVVGKIRPCGNYHHKDRSGNKTKDLAKDAFGIKAALAADPKRSNRSVAKTTNLDKDVVGRIRASGFSGHTLERPSSATFSQRPTAALASRHRLNPTRAAALVATR